MKTRTTFGAAGAGVGSFRGAGAQNERGFAEAGRQAYQLTGRPQSPGVTPGRWSWALHLNIVQLPGLGGVLRLAPALTSTEEELALRLEMLDKAIGDVPV
jgi:hypothetical protein